MNWLKEADLKRKQVKTIAEVKKLAGVDGGADFIIILGGGGIFTRYHLAWDGQEMFVDSYADGSERDLTIEQFMDPAETNFAEAMRKGAFYWEE